WRGAPIRDFYDNCGGHLAVGLMAAPLYNLFGDSYLVLKLIPVLLGLGCVLLIASIGTRLFSRNAGLLAALLFVVGPTTLVKYSMLAKGNHFENLFFQLFMLWAFVRLHDGGKRSVWLPLFGLAAGFSIFFYFGSMLMVALLVTTHLLIGGKYAVASGAWSRFFRETLGLAISFAIGLIPLVWVQAGNHRPSDYIDNHLGSGSRWAQISERMAEFAQDLLPRSTCYPDWGPISGSVGDRAYLGMFLLVWAIGLFLAAFGVWRFLRGASCAGEPSGERALQQLKWIPLAGYFPLFALVYAVSAYRFDVYLKPVEIGQFRYLVPHFAFACLLIAGVAQHLMGARNLFSKGLGKGVAGLALALGLFIVPLVGWSSAATGLGSRYEGYYWTYYMNALMRDTRMDPDTGRFTWDFQAIRGYMGEFSRPEQQAIAHGVGYWLGGSQLQNGVVDGKLVVPAGIDLVALGSLHSDQPRGEWQPDLIRGAGTYLRNPVFLMDPSVAGVGKELQRLAALDDPMAQYVVEGLSWELEYPLLRDLPRHLGRSLEFEGVIPPKFSGAYRRGLGLQVGLIMARGWAAADGLLRTQIERASASEADSFWLGVGLGVANGGTLPDGGEVWSRWIPEEHRGVVWQGIGAAFRHAFGEQAGRAALLAAVDALPVGFMDEVEVGLTWPGYPSPDLWSDR
ncbi:MAG: glycosyltransferase family 39 protein, partial [Planctomycetes bacterium]|nr:glycosyltransferase family 39 protein [Planctomycetota bacterium]